MKLDEEFIFLFIILILAIIVVFYVFSGKER